MAAEGQFKATTHNHRMNCGHDWLCRLFYITYHSVQARLHARFGCTELTDVGTAREGLATTGQHDGFDGRVVVGLLQAVGDALARGQTQTVDGRVHQGDDRHVTVDFVFCCHAEPLINQEKERSFVFNTNPCRKRGMKTLERSQK